MKAEDPTPTDLAPEVLELRCLVDSIADEATGLAERKGLSMTDATRVVAVGFSLMLALSTQEA